MDRESTTTRGCRRRSGRWNTFEMRSIRTVMRMLSARAAGQMLHVVRRPASTARNSASVAASSNASRAPGFRSNRESAATNLKYSSTGRRGVPIMNIKRTLGCSPSNPTPGGASRATPSTMRSTAVVRACGRATSAAMQTEARITLSRISRSNRSLSFTPGCCARAPCKILIAASRDVATTSSKTTSGRAMSSVEDSTCTPEVTVPRFRNKLAR